MNRHDHSWSQDFKSCVSTNFTTRAHARSDELCKVVKSPAGLSYIKPLLHMQYLPGVLLGEYIFSSAYIQVSCIQIFTVLLFEPGRTSRFNHTSGKESRFMFRQRSVMMAGLITCLSTTLLAQYPVCDRLQMADPVYIMSSTGQILQFPNACYAEAAGCMYDVPCAEQYQCPPDIGVRRLSSLLLLSQCT